MKKIVYILFLLPFIGNSQSGLYVHIDTIFSFDPLTGVYTQLTKTVPSQSGQSGKVLSTNGSSYTWITPFSGAFGALTGTPTTLAGYGISNGQTTITTGTTAQYLLGDLSLATFPTTTAGFTNSANKNFVTDAQSTVVSNTSGTNSGDNAVNSNYSSLVSNATHTGDATGATALVVVKINGTSLAALGTGILKNTTGTGVPSIAVQADVTGLLGAASITNTMLAGSIAASKLIGTDIQTLGLNTSYNGVTSVSNGLSQVVAQINATSQTANIATATLYAVPSAGFYRVSIYITITQAATTSSTMPSTTIAYTDGNAGTNAHSTVTTATSAGNSVTTTFAQTTYVLYAKASTNITYATGSYASSGATVMNFALRIKCEAL